MMDGGQWYNTAECFSFSVLRQLQPVKFQHKSYIHKTIACISRSNLVRHQLPEWVMKPPQLENILIYTSSFTVAKKQMNLATHTFRVKYWII